MAEGLTDDLLLVTCVVGTLAMLVAWHRLPLGIALFAASVRVTISATYFAWYFDGAWTILDDLGYFSDGADMLRAGFNPLTALLTDEGYEHLTMLSGGHHVLYTWWNTVALSLFGEHYYAPVFLNVLLTFVVADLFGWTLSVLGFERGYCRALQVFYLLHWDVVAWSSFINLKDVLVQVLTVAAFAFGIAFVKRRQARFLIGFLAIVATFYFLRFYVSLLIALTFVLWLFMQWHDYRRVLIVPLVLMGGMIWLPQFSQFSTYLDPQAFVTGSARMLLTPLPWSVTDNYSFLLYPSALHALLLVPAAAAGVMLWRMSSWARLYLIYFAIIILLYAVTEELQGPRHRFQIAFIFAWLQFHFFWSVLAFGHTVRRRAMPAPLRTLATNLPRPGLAATRLKSGPHVQDVGARRLWQPTSAPFEVHPSLNTLAQ